MSLSDEKSHQTNQKYIHRHIQKMLPTITQPSKKPNKCVDTRREIESDMRMRVMTNKELNEIITSSASTFRRKPITRHQHRV